MSDFKRMNKKTFKEVMKHWRENIFNSNCINDSFKCLDVNPIDFYEFLNTDFECSTEFEKTSSLFDIYRETEIEKRAMTAETISPTMLVRIIEAKNKSRYWKDANNEQEGISAKTDEELDDLLKTLFDKVRDKNKIID